MKTYILNNFSIYERALILALFYKEGMIENEQDLKFIKNKAFVLTMKREFDKLPQDKFNRYRVLIKSILDKI